MKKEKTPVHSTCRLMAALLAGAAAFATASCAQNQHTAVGRSAPQSLLNNPLPSIAMTCPDGHPVEIRTAENRLAVRMGDRHMQPKAMLVHFFQPDCLQCQWEMEALQGVHDDFADRGVFVLGVAHRGDSQEVRSIADQLDVNYPLAIGVGNDVVKTHSAGDAMAIVDSAGIVRYRQPGYRPPHNDQPGDEALWRENLALLIDGKPVKHTTVNRKELAAGDQFPEVQLDDIFTGRPMRLSRDANGLYFRGVDGRTVRPKAAIGLFSRYCQFTREEMQFFQQLRQKYAEKDLFVFTIAMMPNPEETPDATRELGVTYPVFHGYGSDLGQRFAYGCPAYIIDGSGIIRYTQTGFEKEDEQKYEAYIQDILKTAR